MKSLKTDPRSRYTREIVKSKLLALLKSKPLKSITVAEVCADAQITRGTFYNHFYDVYDVYESVEKEFSDAIIGRMRSIKAYALDYAFYNEILSFISENRDFTAVVVANIGESSLLKQIISYARDKYVTEFTEYYPGMEKTRIDTAFTYIVNGSIGLLVEWLKRDMPESTQRMAERIERLNRLILTGYLKADA